MASAELSRRVEKVVGYPPLCDMGADQRREFNEALLEADELEDLPGKWQAAIVKAEQNQPKLRVVDQRLSRQLTLEPREPGGLLSGRSRTSCSSPPRERRPLRPSGCPRCRCPTR
jgi:hypothetical protein